MERELTSIEQSILNNYLGDWERYEDDGIFKLQKVFHFECYKKVLEMVQKIGSMAEIKNHHPLLKVEYKTIDVHWWSHDISGLSLRDYLCAAAVDVLVQNNRGIRLLNGDYKLPSEKYVPGVNKKPLEHMEFYHLLSNKEALNEHNTMDHQEFHYGIDLFNTGYFWETHEVLEDVWNRAGRKSELARAIQSIIFFAAAKLKQLKGDFKSASKHFSSAKSCMTPNNVKFLGIDYESYLSEIEMSAEKSGIVSKITII